jgi:hypothetical protein
MKRIAIGIDQPPGRLVDERVVISRISGNDREEAGDAQRAVQSRNIANHGPKRTRGRDTIHTRTNLLIQWAGGVSFSTIW